MTYGLEEAFDNDALSQKFNELGQQDEEFLDAIQSTILEKLSTTDHAEDAQAAAFMLNGFLAGLLFCDEYIAELQNTAGEAADVDPDLITVQLTKDQAASMLNILLGQ